MADRRVLLFGLSGDPPTGDGGHLGVVRWAAERGIHPELGGRLDAIWILPVYRHAYAAKAGLSSYEHRLEMCRLCFEQRGFPVDVTVMDLERELAMSRGQQHTGTVDVVEHLQALHPEASFGLLLGADTAADLLRGRWRRSKDLLAQVRLVVVPRVGVGGELLRGVTAADAPALDSVSSTAARQRRDLTDLVVPEVAAYIQAQGLYGNSGSR